jgi:3'-phosphoadenosine 5'-phosphosulfate sulfotransferase (PAPS reductase)/FAD synthetase
MSLHVVSWSGGKDSSALVVWALVHLPQADTRYVFCDTGWKSPLTYRFIEAIKPKLFTDIQSVTLANDGHGDALNNLLYSSAAMR